jgi:hypothetical protein
MAGLLAGLVSSPASVHALILVVDDDGMGTAANCNDVVPCFSTIAAAVTAALLGDTILVCPGTYLENVTINKRVNLHGAQQGVPACLRVIGSPSPTTESIIAPAGGTLILLVTGSAGTVIDGFSLIGGLRGIESSTGPIDNVAILNNHIAGFTGSGIFLNDNGNDITIHQNNVNGASRVGGGASVHLDTDLFRGFHLTSNCIANGGTGAGFFTDGNHNVRPSITRLPLIDCNRIENNTANVGMNLGTRAVDSCLIRNNLILNNAFDGIQGGIQNSRITLNRFAGNGRWGLALTSFGNLGVDRGGQRDTITFNTFTDNDSAGFFISAAQAVGNAASIRTSNNNFVGNGGGGGAGMGVIYRGTETIEVTNNWWGDAGGPDYPPANPNPPADGLFATSANYSPWLSGPVAGSPTCDGPTGTVLAMFQATPGPEGVQIRWRFGEGAALLSIAVDRAEAAAGPWSEIRAEIRQERDVSFALDRDAEAGRTYFYRLRVTTGDGQFLTFGPLSVTTGSGHTEFALGVKPNPMDDLATIDFVVPYETHVRLSVVDLQGRQVALLADGRHRAGHYQLTWNGSGARGAAPAGIYFLRLKSADRVLAQRVIVR